MYNILIVDDEEIICRGIKAIIEYINNPYINKIFISYDSSHAEELIMQNDIHMVFTDIRMPGKSGLDLIKNIFKFRKDIKFVVLSGYDDFHYVKEAFKLGVNDYLKKPASISEIKETLEKIIKDIEDQFKNKQKKEEERYLYNQIFIENTFNKLFINPNIDTENIKHILSENKITFTYDDFCISIIETKKINIFNDNIKLVINNLIQNSLNAFLQHGTANTSIDFFHFFDYKNNLVILFNFNQVCYGELKKYTLTLYKFIQQNFNNNPFLAISEVQKGIYSICTLYKQSTHTLSYRLIYEPNILIEYNNIKNKSSDMTFFNEYLNKLKEAIYTLDEYKTTQIINRMFDLCYIGHQSIESIENTYNLIKELLVSFLKGANCFLPSFKDFKSFNTIEDLKDYIIQNINSTIQFSKTHVDENKIIYLGKQYIEKNFSKDINMAVVANSVGVSYNYFSTLFRDEVGMNFSEYLTKVRMENAKKILANPLAKINEVAKKVGYGNSKYFARAFKAHYGISPKDYSKTYKH